MKQIIFLWCKIFRWRNTWSGPWRLDFSICMLKCDQMLHANSNLRSPTVFLHVGGQQTLLPRVAQHFCQKDWGGSKIASWPRVTIVYIIFCVSVQLQTKCAFHTFWLGRGCCVIARCCAQQLRGANSKDHRFKGQKNADGILCCFLFQSMLTGSLKFPVTICRNSWGEFETWIEGC